MQTLLRTLILRLFGGYQRHCSPYKGFCCAHAACHRRGGFGWP